MRQLLLFRHGTAAEKTAQLDDLNRPLTEHGVQQVIHMAEKLQTEKFVPECIFASPAKRTLQTAQELGKIFGINDSIDIQPTLYHATTADILTFLETCPEEIDSIILVGHNPGISECAGLLAKQHVPDLKPAGICWLQWPEHESWEDIANGLVVNVKALAL